MNKELAYWAGFIAADGCLTNDDRNIVIHLSDKDSGHLERFKCFLGDLSKGKVRYGNYNDYYFSIQNAGLTAVLIEKFNITARKTGRLIFPDRLSEEEEKSFICGYIDGDGCFDYHISGSKNWKYLRIQIDGNKEFLRELGKRLPANGVLSVRSRPGNSEHSCLKYVGQKAMTVRGHLYDESLPLMPRKWSKDEFRIPR